MSDTSLKALNDAEAHLKDARDNLAAAREHRDQLAGIIAKLTIAVTKADLCAHKAEVYAADARIDYLTALRIHKHSHE